MLAHFRRLVQPLSGRQPHGSLGVNTSLSRKTGLPHPTSRHCTRIAFSRCFSNQLCDLRLQAGSSLSPAYGGRPGTSRCGLLLTRSYTRRAEPQELESTVETEAVPCSEDVEEGRKKKEKKRSKKNKTTTKASKKETTTKASKKKDVSSSPVAKEDLGIELNFPFEGTISKPEIETVPETPETHGKSVTSTSGGDAFTVHMADATDGSDARVYNICRDGEAVFHLPSVTTILSQTLPRQRGFMLSNWRRGLVRELGEGGYLQVRDQTRASGKRFHAVSKEERERGGEGRGWTKMEQVYMYKVYLPLFILLVFPFSLRLSLSLYFPSSPHLLSLSHRSSLSPFSQAVEAQLHRPHLLSIKTKDHPSHPPILTPHTHNHTHYSPIPPPLKYPLNHHNKSPTLLHTPSLADSDECRDSDSDSLVEEEEEEEKKAGVDEDGMTAVTDVGAGDAVATSTDSSAATESRSDVGAGDAVTTSTGSSAATESRSVG